MTAAVSRHRSQDLGWDPGWATAFLPFDAAGLAAGPGRRRPPRRVGRGHPGGDLDARDLGPTSATRRSDPADLPAVGDWVAVGHGGSAAIDAESDACIQAVIRPP